MIRRTHQAPERYFENQPHDGLKASVADLLESLFQVRSERDQAHAQIRQQDSRIALLRRDLERQRQRASFLQETLETALKRPQRRRQRPAHPHQIPLSLQQQERRL